MHPQRLQEGQQVLRATEKCRLPRARDSCTLLCTQAHPTRGKASRAASASPLHDTRHSRSLFVTANIFIGRERRGRKTCNHLPKLQKVAKTQPKDQVPQPAPGCLWQVHLGGPAERRQLSFVPGKGWPRSLEEKQGVGVRHTHSSQWAGHATGPKLWNKPMCLQSGGSLAGGEGPARPLPAAKTRPP